MKRNWVGLITLVAIISSPASAQEFEVFGLKLDQFSQSYLDDNHVPERRRKHIGFATMASLTDYPIGNPPSSLSTEIGMWGWQYDSDGRNIDPFSRQPYGELYNIKGYEITERYTQEHVDIHNAYVAASFYRAGNGTYGVGDLSDTNDATIKDKLEQFLAIDDVYMARWLSCSPNRRNGRSNCPQDIKHPSVTQVWILQPTLPDVEGSALRISIDLARGKEIDQAQAAAAIAAQYPQAERQDFKFENKPWSVFIGEREVLGTDGSRFFIQVTPARFQARFGTAVHDQKQRVTLAYNELQELGEQFYQNQAQERTNSIFGGNE